MATRETRVLIIDDDRELVALSAKSLVLLGAADQVATASSAQQAFRKMLAEPFDLVISDMHMPGMDGLTLLRQVRTYYPDMRLMLMTGDFGKEIERRAREAGVHHCIAKPYVPRQLAETVSALLTDADHLRL
jgi:CheY-like chemotaxis protein